MKNGFKPMKNAEIWVQVVTNELINPEGQVIKRELTWQKLDADVNLGSMKKPQNEKIVGFKVVNTKQEQIDIKGFFGNLFGE